MGKLFENIAVLNKKNEIIFDRINDQVFCSEFFGQVLSAFDALTSHIADGDLSNIEWGDELITIKKENDLIFIACCASKKANEKKINEEMDTVINKFFDLYSKVLLESYKGNRQMFSNSEQRLIEAIKDLID